MNLISPIFNKYLYGTVKISFQDNPPLRINEGRHSFVGFESISKRDQEMNDFLKKNLEKSSDFLKKNLEKTSDLKLKGVSSSNSQVSTPFYSTKAESSSPYGNVAVDDEEDSVSVTPSDFDSPPIENSPVYQNQLRVLTVLNDDFEIDWFALYNEFMLSKNKPKRKYFQNNFPQSEKDCVKRKLLEKMNQWKKHILFFDFLENHYVSKDEVSKQHLNVIKKIKFY